MYTEANETPLEPSRLKLSMHYYLKTRACTDNPAHHALHEFDPTTRDLYLSKTKWKRWHDSTPDPTSWCQGRVSSDLCRGWCRNGLPLEDAKLSTWNTWIRSCETQPHWRSKFMITREETRAKFHEYHNALGPHDEVYTDVSKINERVGAAAVINGHFQNGKTTCRQLSKRLPNNSTIFAAEATAITLALDYYQYMDHVKHDVVVYSDSMSCLQAKIVKTLSSAISWTSSGHWTTKGLVSASAGCQAIAASRVTR